MKKMCVVGLLLALWVGAEGYVILTETNSRGRIVTNRWSPSRGWGWYSLCGQCREFSLSRDRGGADRTAGV